MALENGTAPQHVCSATGPGVAADPRLCSPPCYSTYPIVPKANASMAMNLRGNVAGELRRLSPLELIMVS
jgi:hypothetical protein